MCILSHMKGKRQMYVYTCPACSTSKYDGFCSACNQSHAWTARDATCHVFHDDSSCCNQEAYSAFRACIQLQHRKMACTCNGHVEPRTFPTSAVSHAALVAWTCER